MLTTSLNTAASPGCRDGSSLLRRALIPVAVAPSKIRRATAALAGVIGMGGAGLAHADDNSLQPTVLGTQLQGGSAQPLDSPAAASPYREESWILGGANLRSGPATSYGSLGYLTDAMHVHMKCWLDTQPVSPPQSNFTSGRWFLVDTLALGGSVGYVHSSFVANQIETPPCPTTTAPSPTAPMPTAAESAVAWAQRYADNGDTSYNDLCLTFVGDAYTQAKVDYRSQIDYAIDSNTYPVDIWSHFIRGTTGTDTAPPRGSWVFWASATGDRTLSHVALSLGDGRLASTSDGVEGRGTHYETLEQHAYAHYLGWWLPTA